MIAISQLFVLCTAVARFGPSTKNIAQQRMRALSPDQSPRIDWLSVSSGFVIGLSHWRANRVCPWHQFRGGGVFFGVAGLSHIVQPKARVEFLILLRDQGKTGVFVDGLLNLPLAAIIIGFHSVWSGIPRVLTLVGWCLLIKSLIRLCAPGLALRAMARVSMERSWEFQVAGFVVLVGLLGYGLHAG